MNLLNNRAMCAIKMGMLSEALVDSRCAISIDSTGFKTNYRAADVLLRLRCYDESKAILESLIGCADGIDKEVKSKLIQIAKLQRQSKIGDYMPGELNVSDRSCTHLDFEDYIGPLELRASKGKGRGLFLTESVKAGKLLLLEIDQIQSESVFTMPSVDSSSRTAYSSESEDLVYGILEKANRCKATRARIALLYDGDCVNMHIVPMEAFQRDNHPMLDTLANCTISAQQVRGILNSNAFGKNGSHNCQLYVVASLINHSSLNNAIHSCVGRVMELRARVDIAAGEELTVQYASDPSTLLKWGIEEDAH